MTAHPAVCTCNHVARDHLTLGLPDLGGLRLGACTQRAGLHDACTCPVFDAAAGYDDPTPDDINDRLIQAVYNFDVASRFVLEAWKRYITDPSDSRELDRAIRQLEAARKTKKGPRR